MSEERKSARDALGKRFLTIGKFALLAGVLVAVGLFSAVIGMQLAIRGNNVAAPDLLGRPRSEAEALVKQSNLRLAVIAERYDASLPKGIVLSQNPGPGGQVKTGSKVRVAISLGERQHPVPHLVGQSLRAARALILQTEYKVGTVSEIKLAGVVDGQVIRQTPQAGTETSDDGRIDLLVTRNAPPEFVMPDVRGRELGAVNKLFASGGFRVGNVRYEPSPFVEAGTVLRQYPQAGSRLRADQKINLEVAKSWP